MASKRIGSEPKSSEACPSEPGLAKACQSLYLRHFVQLSMPNVSAHLIGEIYAVVMKNFLDQSFRDGAKFPSVIMRFQQGLVNASSDLFHRCIGEFKPSPTRFLNCFTLHDLSRLFQGLP